MFPYWNYITGPLVEAFRPNSMLEVGAEKGRTTDLLAGYCLKHGATLHVVDPVPQFDIGAYQRKMGESFHVYKDLSLNALPKVGPVDIAFLDGDHNWYTIYKELHFLEEQAIKTKTPFPLTFMHDVGWPYARRDLYYDPQTIPEKYRQPYERKGMIPGQSKLAETGGINFQLYHAVEENTPRNGVRTGIEDFISESKLELDFFVVPGFFGLGVIAPKALRRSHSAVAALLDQWDLPAAVNDYLQNLENTRIYHYMQQVKR